MKQFPDWFHHRLSYVLYFILTAGIGLVISAKAELSLILSAAIASIIAFTAVHSIDQKLFRLKISQQKYITVKTDPTDDGRWDLNIIYPNGEVDIFYGLTQNYLIIKLRWLEYFYGSLIYIPPDLKERLHI